VLVVPRLDRLARSMRDLRDTVERVRKQDIGLRSLFEDIDTTTAGGRLVMQVFGAIAEFEANLIRERTRSGLAYARSQGRRGGRPRSLSDVDIEQARTLLLHTDQPVGEIAHSFGVSREQLYRVFPGGRQGLRQSQRDND